MKLFLKLLYIIIILLFFWSNSDAQNQINKITVTDSIPINFNNNYPLSAISIVPFSEIVHLRGKILNKKDYNISYSQAFLSLSDSLPYSVYDTIIVTYQAYRISLKKEYRRRSLVVKYDDRFSDTIKVLQKEPDAFTAESIFGKDIQKSGTIMRGLTIGTTRDFTLNSGLRLQLSGKLSDNINLVAALTDENTPIQPEGNTEKLDELDKVFIEVTHPNASGTFGDYDLNTNSGEFGSINRKLQGLKSSFSFNNYSGNIAVAGSKGKFNTNQFNGIDGVQGPYRLNGVNNERDIIIIAGSEKVYIDGVEMKRGERNDYVIEYSNAEITFTPYRLITSASRITVDFEYTDRQFSRSFFSSGFQTKQLNNKLNVNINYFREGDNQDAPIDISLSDADKRILEAAGDNPLAATKSGITLAQPDSTGIIKGTYTKIDTVYNNNPYSIYIYSPNNAQYNVTFTYVGEGKGDYNRESLGIYTFTGIGQGAYLPVIFLPLPELKQVGNIVVSGEPFKDVNISMELAGSLWDKNRFSILNNNDDFGSARNIVLSVKPKEIRLFNVNLGKAGFSYKDRFIQSTFTTLDRINEVEFNRDYNVSTNINGNEQLREASLNLIPVSYLNINSMYGSLKEGNSFSSDRFLNSFKLNNKDNYNMEYTVDYVKSDNTAFKSNWIRQSGNAYFIWQKIKPGIQFLAEDRRDKAGISDSLSQGSLKYNEVIPSVELIDLKGINIKADYSLREDYFPLNGILVKESNSYTQSYELNYHGISEVSSAFRFVIRNKKYTELYKNNGSLDNETILIRSQTRMNFWERIISSDIYYEVSTERSAKLQRIFVRVPVGTGNYKYTGDLNNNGIAEENEFEPTLYDGDFIATTYPTDQLFPVIDLKANTRWKLEMEKIFDKNSLAGKILSPLSSETSFRIEENSRETNTKKIYLLDPSAFLNDSTTINGFNYLQQDLFLFEHSSEFSMRFRFAQRKSLNQFSYGIEKGFNKERSIRLIFKMIPEIGNQTDFTNQIDNAAAPLNSNRAHLITANILSTDFSYRPQNNIEVGFKIGVSQNEDDFPKIPTILDQNSQALRLTLSLAGKGRLRVEIERNELNANTDQNYLPFELTNGYSIGKNYSWRLNFDYRLTGNLQSTINYDGRFHGSGNVIHTATAEVRAYF